MLNYPFLRLALAIYGGVNSLMERLDDGRRLKLLHKHAQDAMMGVLFIPFLPARLGDGIFNQFCAKFISSEPEFRNRFSRRRDWDVLETIT